MHGVVSVGRYHRDGRAEQTHTHLPGLPCNGAKPEQLASLRVDPAAGCSEGLGDVLKSSSLKICSLKSLAQLFCFSPGVRGAALHSQRL